jgi:hypothetical protein
MTYIGNQPPQIVSFPENPAILTNINSVPPGTYATEMRHTQSQNKINKKKRILLNKSYVTITTAPQL